MIHELDKLAIPGWLSDVDAMTINNKSFPLQEILTDSLYYPCAAFDGDPVKLLSGNFCSFIYADYAISRQDLDYELIEHGFSGYDILTSRVLTEMDLSPNGFTPVMLLPKDGTPLRSAEVKKESFAEWIIFERGPDYTDEHGPSRFSLVYLSADGVASFQALYVSNGAIPKAVAIIQPGTGFGGNWTDFRNQDLIFGRTVLQNPAGIPEYLLCAEGERSPESFWPEYGVLVKMLWTGKRQIGIWNRSKGETHE